MTPETAVVPKKRVRKEYTMLNFEQVVGLSKWLEKKKKEGFLAESTMARIVEEAKTDMGVATLSDYQIHRVAKTVGVKLPRKNGRPERFTKSHDHTCSCGKKFRVVMYEIKK